MKEAVNNGIRAVLIDLGDVLMIEETEEKDADGAFESRPGWRP